MTFRVLVTGSRTWLHAERVHATLADVLRQHPDMLLVHGAYPYGVDQQVEEWATWCSVPTEKHPAQWTINGRRAGLLRNQHMVNLGADLCLAFIRNHSTGATRCLSAARTAGIPTHVQRA